VVLDVVIDAVLEGGVLHDFAIKTFLTASDSPLSLAICGAILSPERLETGSPTRMIPTASVVLAFSCCVDAVAKASESLPLSAASWVHVQL
jgi:hypothetical protein